MPATRSCADRLHQLQKDVGLSDKELKAAIKRHTTPREVKLPTFHEKLTKQEKRRREIMQPGNKKRKYKMAYWYLEKYLEPSESWKVYMEHQDFKELVNYAYQMVLNLVQLQTYVTDDDPDIKTFFPDEPDGKYDIPEELDREFKAYAKKHPLKSSRDIIPRRKKFQKYRRKRRRRLYSKKHMRMYDPLFAATIVDSKEMYKNLQRIGRENEIRVRKFQEMLNSLVKDQSIGSEAMSMFNHRTKIIQEQYEKRLDQFMKQSGLKPNPVMYDFT